MDAFTAKHEEFQDQGIEITADVKLTQRLTIEAKRLRPEVYKMMQDAPDAVGSTKVRPLIYSGFLIVFCN